MNNSLNGQVAWITGGGSGIGLAGAIELARAGAHVVISGRNPETTLAAEKTLRTHGSAEAILLDVADKHAVQRVAEQVLAKLGRIDILVNSAGINTRERSLDNISLDDWDNVIAINLSGLFYAVHAVLPGMRKLGGGLIVNVGSWAGLHPGRLSGVAYGASKRAVNSLTESINIEECAYGIRATALIPGEVATPILQKRAVIPTEAQRDVMVQPEDMGNAILFLALMPARTCVNELVITPTLNRTHAPMIP